MLAAFWILLALAIYLIPTAVGYNRRHNSGDAIFILNLLLGWTVLGWIAALIWANTGNVAAAPGAEVRVKCPECRELVLRDARKCKHCGTTLSPSIEPLK